MDRFAPNILPCVRNVIALCTVEIPVIRPAHALNAPKPASLLLLLLFLLASRLLAQPYVLDIVKEEKAISQASVWAIVEDKKGFLWVGTQDGLNRYDGYEFGVIKHRPFDSTSISSNFISALCLDKTGKLWAGTRLEGLNLFDPVTQKSITFNKGNPRYKLFNNDIHALYQDKAGKLWVGTSTGLDCIISQTDPNGKLHYKTFHFDLPVIPNLKTNQHITSIQEDAKSQIWIGTQAGLYLFANFSPLAQPMAIPQWQQPDTLKVRVSSIVHDKNGTTWVGSNKGISRYNAEKGIQQSFGQGLLNGDGVESLLVDSHQLLWIGTTSGKLLGVRLGGAPFQGQLVEVENKHNSVFPEVRRLYEISTHPGIIWVGTYSDGLLKVYPKDQRFRTHTLSEYPGVSSRSVTSLYKDSAALWVVCNEGLIYEDNEVGKQLIKIDPKGLPERASFIRHIHKDRLGQMWAVSNGGIFQLQKRGRTHVPVRQQLAPECQNDPYLYIHEDSEGYVYFSTAKKINVLSPKTRKFLPCPILPDTILESSRRNRIHVVLRDKSNRFWIGTSVGMLLLRDCINPVEDLASKGFEYFRHNPQDTSSLMSNTVLCIFEDSKRDIWLGTVDGLVRVKDDGKRIQFQNYTKSNGLPAQSIYGILEDTAKKHLWVSTNKGLFRLHLPTGFFENFDEKDGLQGNEFNSPATFMAADGEMYWGGTRGFSHFYPKSIKSDSTNPRVYITHILDKNGLRNDLLYTDDKKLTLDYFDNTFSVHFIGIHYANTEKLKYFYTLLKEDEDPRKAKWTELGDVRQVSFSNLAPGKYIFRVTANTNNTDDFKNGNIERLDISINPPFWQTAWFFFILLLAVGSLLTIVHQIRVQQKVNRVMDLERVRKNTAADFHDEMGGKLSVISLFAGIVKSSLNENQSNLYPHLDKVIDNSHSIYLSMKDLLWTLDPKKDTLHDLALMLKDFGDHLFDKTGISFYTEGIVEEMANYNLLMEQKRHIALIFKEVMNNALKHSACKHTHLSFEWNPEQFRLRIMFKDDGKGFDPKNLRSGNGLTNLEFRANQLGAKINTQTEIGKGTRIQFEIVFTHFRKKSPNRLVAWLQQWWQAWY